MPVIRCAAGTVPRYRYILAYGFLFAELATLGMGRYEGGIREGKWCATHSLSIAASWAQSP
jgi:hypothetical protein